jgi:hypothetical protein
MRPRPLTNGIADEGGESESRELHVDSRGLFKKKMNRMIKTEGD